MGKKRLTKKDIDSIKKLHASGKSIMQITIEKKISLWTVKYHLDEKYRQSVIKSNLNRNHKITKKKINGK